MRWEVNEDKFFYVCKPVIDQARVTRRGILSQVASMYDPLGLISPIGLRGRQIFQEATRLKLSWDEVVPFHIAKRWMAWWGSMSSLSEVMFDRCVIPADFVDGVAELHHFCDGSQVGYGACAYVRVANRHGQIHVALLASKSRLAPLRQISIPRVSSGSISSTA